MGETTYDPHGVARGEGEDVGAGDDAGAGRLELCLDGVDDVVAAEALVERRVLLRRVVGRGVEKNRPLAALRAVNPVTIVSSTCLAINSNSWVCASFTYSEQAVDGEEPEQGAGEAGRLGEDGGHLLEHDVLRLRARLVVRPELRVGLRRATQGKERRRHRDDRYSC